MPLQQLDFQRSGGRTLKGWLAPVSLPIVILAWSDWRRKADCEEMMRTIEALSKDPKYSKHVIFYWFNPDDDGDSCNELSIHDTPCVVLYKSGQEVAKFTTASSKSGIMHQLDILLDPSKRHLTRASAAATARGVSTFTP